MAADSNSTPARAHSPVRPLRPLLLALLATVLVSGAHTVAPAGAADLEPGQARAGSPEAVDVELSPSGNGYWVLDNAGRVFNVGDAPYLGGAAPMESGEVAVAIAPTLDGEGYRVFTSIGRVFAYGSATDLGDLVGIDLAGPIVDAATTASGDGYYMLGSDGGIFAFGDAGFYGSIQSVVNVVAGPGVAASDWLSEPIVGIGPTPTGQGYWLVASDGGMFAFGDAEFRGSVPQILGPGAELDRPIVGLVPHADGYLMVGADGGIFSFGTSRFHGSIPGLLGGESDLQAAVEVVNVSVLDDRSGYVMVESDGRSWAFGEASATIGGLGPIEISVPSHPGDFFNCSDFSSVNAAQRWFDTYRPFYGDPANLDEDSDGFACEIDLIAPEAGLTIAFVGNSGLGSSSAQVMEMIADRSPDLLVHLGGFDHVDSPEAFNVWLDATLGSGVPVVAVPGAADVAEWDDYQQILANRATAVEGLECTGDYGVNASCTFGGVHLVLSGTGTVGEGHEEFIEARLASSENLWRLCLWNKNQRAVQISGQSSEAGWVPYELCREAGALVVNANSATYSRTKTLVDTSAQTVDPEWPDADVTRVGPGAGSVIVAGLGGRAREQQSRCLPAEPPYGCNGEWASVLSSLGDAPFGALFVEFGVGGDPRLAAGQFVGVDGSVEDSFTINNENGS